MNETLMDLNNTNSDSSGRTHSAGESPYGDGSKGKGKGKAKVILWLLLILLIFAGGLAFYYFSNKNNHTYYVLQEETAVLVKRGIFFPTGSRLYQDHGAFAPLPVSESFKMEPVKVDDARQVDRILFDILKKEITAALHNRTPESLDQAKEYLRRARLLDVPEHEFDKLMQVRGDIALGEAQSILSNIAPLLRTALMQMQGAAHLETTEYGDPRLWIEWTKERLGEFESIERNSSAINQAPRYRICEVGSVAPPAQVDSGGDVAGAGEEEEDGDDDGDRGKGGENHKDTEPVPTTGQAAPGQKAQVEDQVPGADVTGGDSTGTGQVGTGNQAPPQETAPKVNAPVAIPDSAIPLPI